MPKFRKRPVTIEAVVWNPDDTGKQIGGWPESWGPMPKQWPIGLLSMKLFIPTLEGEMTAKVGDYIVRGVRGEFYPCEPNIFRETYEAVNE